MSEEAKQWIEKFREVAHSAAEKAERAQERLIHAEAEGDEVLAACLPGIRLREHI